MSIVPVPKDSNFFELKNQWSYLGGLYKGDFVASV